MTEFTSIGKRIPKSDARDKVTGRAIYMEDLKVPGMLFGRILFSTFPHAKILHVDTSKAKKLVGVRAVLTGRDIPPIRFGFLKDNVPLKWGKVRSCRDEVAAVAAIDPDIAEEAIHLIGVEYEALPGVFDPEEAMKEGAPLIHEVDARGDPLESNVLTLPWKLLAGDVDKARTESAYITEDRLKTPWVTHVCMGTMGIIAEFDLRNNLTVYANTQIPYLAQRDYNEALAAMGLRRSKARIIQPTIGGGFGSKLDTYGQDYIAILLAHKTRKPVKIQFTREEEFFATSPRQPTIINIAQGCTEEGRLTFRDVSMILDNGAYASWGATTPSVMMMPISSLYKVPNVRYIARCVYTNNTWSQAMRGYGNPQATFAVECNLDHLAETAGIDPAEMRIVNSNVPGEVTPQRFKVTSCGLKECIERVADQLEWESKHGRRNCRGVGMASLIHVGGGARVYKSDGCGTIIKVDDFGTVDVFTGATDIGQGADTVIAQVVAEVLGVGVEDVNVIDDDTEVCPWDVGVHASRTTFVACNSAIGAAKKVREQILELAAGYMEIQQDKDGTKRETKLDDDPGNLVIEDRMVYSTRDPKSTIPLEKILRGSHYRTGGKMVMAEYFYDPNNENLDREFKGNLSMTYAYGTHGVEVEVDRETGKVRILKYIAAHDVGRAINPMLLEGQIYGGVSMGVGYGLTEQLVFDKGECMNPSFRDYKILTAKDVIPVEAIIVETVDRDGPFGAKGIGEPGCVPSAPAIANAIYDAIGVRVHDLPITPEKILRALREKKGIEAQ